MSVVAIIRAFGFDGEVSVERQFNTPFGLPKAIVRVGPSGRLFVGSLRPFRPTKEHLDWLLPRLNQMGNRLEGICADVRFGPYFGLTRGGYVLRDGEYHRFVTTAFNGRQARPGLDGAIFARAIGMFHRAAAQAIAATPLGSHPRESAVGALTNFILPNLHSVRRDGLNVVDGLLDSAIERLSWIRDYRAAEIDRLPPSYSHNDFWPRHVLIGKEHDGRMPIRIVGAEQACLQSRLFDLYFLLMGDANATTLDDLGALEQHLAEYQAAAGLLSETERHLLPNVIQVKAGGVAAWAAGAYMSERSEQLELLPRYFLAAFRCIDVVHNLRAEIREIAGRSQR